MDVDIQATRVLTENLYYIVGVVVVSGIGTIFTALKFAFSKVVWIAKLEFRIERLEKDLNHAYAEIRSLKSSGQAIAHDSRDEN